MDKIFLPIPSVQEPRTCFPYHQIGPVTIQSVKEGYRYGARLGAEALANYIYANYETLDIALFLHNIRTGNITIEIARHD